MGSLANKSGLRVKRTGRHRPSLLACCAALLVAGCVGPNAIRQTRLRYNDVYRATNDEQLLLNIVRLRYADSPVFLDLPSITSQFELAGGGSYPGPGGAQTSFGIAGLSGRDTPTLSYHPREGREIARALLTPLTAELFQAVKAGASTEQFLLMAVNDINDVPNASQATVLVPKAPGENTAFRRGVQLLEQLQERDAVELSFSTSDEPQNASDPIPTSRVYGRDILDAAKDGYVFRAKGDSESLLQKREKGLVLRVRPAAVESEEMRELARIFHLTPGLSRYKIKSELAEEANSAPAGPMGDDTIYLNMRSTLQMAVFLSKGVCVPAEHIVSGVAPSTPGPDGRPYDWPRVTSGVFFVHSQRQCPRDAEVAVKYRGYWFYIARNDVASRSAMTVYEILFGLQEADGKTMGPLLTLPVGG